LDLLGFILSHVREGKSQISVADVGAGTGKLTENLSSLGLSGFAVEPNDAMRAEGEKLLDQGVKFKWQKGSAEETGLEKGSADWILMGSSFHWTNSPVALKEFRRVLKPGGYFTAIWNPRDIEKNELQVTIEKKIHEIVPSMSRVSSGGAKYTQDMETKLTVDGMFGHLIFAEALHHVDMSVERYMGAWRSVNDIRAQAGEEKFARILEMIENLIAGEKSIRVHYKSRSWTVKAL
jgi:ubiquinone/menaquinone biosynthesis C-methylase UbiE